MSCETVRVGVDRATSLTVAFAFSRSFGLSAALGDERLQVITNQIYAQLVPHVRRARFIQWALQCHCADTTLSRSSLQVHFHIVPAAMRPSKDDKANKPASTNPLAMMGLGHGREELDDEEGEELAKKIRQAAAQLKNGPNAKL